MFDYKQRPATEEYRENWERIFGRPCTDEEMIERRNQFLDQQQIQTFPMGKKTLKVRTLKAVVTDVTEPTVYPNGCPIIPESN